MDETFFFFVHNIIDPYFCTNLNIYPNTLKKPWFSCSKPTNEESSRRCCMQDGKAGWRKNCNKLLLLFVLYLQNMLDSERFKNLRDFEQVHFQELMESIPNSLGEISQVLDKSEKALKEASRVSTRPQRNSPLRKQQAGYQTEPQNTNNRLESSCDKSSRELFPVARTSDFNQIASEGDRRHERSLSNNNQIGVRQRPQNGQLLKDIIKKYKIKLIVANFVRKIKRISVSSKPVQLEQESDSIKGLLWQQTCFQLPQIAQNIFSFLSIIQVLLLSITVSMSLVFAPLRQNWFMKDLQIFSFLLCLCDLLQNLFTVRSKSGKKLRVFRQIWKAYAQGSMVTDILTVLIVLLNCLIHNGFLLYLQTVVFLKLPQTLDKIERLQAYWIKNFYNEQYWSLVKIIISNFCFAHIISILLAAMVNLSPQQNWMTAKGIGEADWQEQYIWSYYWASTMMLTIGFGDITASNCQEALCLIFIETFSCLVFAYNINCIGTLIQHIRSQDAEKSKRSKIFKKLAKQNRLNEELSWKVNNYIEENAELRKRFNFEEEKEFISNLPVELKKQYLKESNKKIFEHIQFFKSFISKTLYNLAERIEMRVSHPDEVIQKFDDDYNLIILKQGQIGYFCKRSTFTLKDYVMNIKNVQVTDKPYLLNLDFIVKTRPYYEIRSVQYCIFFFLDYNSFIEAVKDSNMDYEYYCGLRDKMKSVPDEFELMKCEVCGSKHLKALCPRLHFIPYNETVIHKYLHKERTSKNLQAKFSRKRKHRQNAFKVYKIAAAHVKKLGSILNSKRRRTDAKITSISQNASELGFTSDTQLQLQREIKQIQEKYMNLTYEIIKEEINKMKNYGCEEDEVWILRLDRLHDFNSYFSKDNPANIKTRLLHLPQKNFPKEGPGTAIIHQIREAFSLQNRHHDHSKESMNKKTIKAQTM